MLDIHQQTEDLRQFLLENDIDVFGFCSCEAMDQVARPGRRPKDIWPEAKSLIVFGCGHADSLTKSWAQEALVGDIVAISITELANRSMKIIRYLRQQGYRGDFVNVHGDGPLTIGIRLADAARLAGIGYIGKSCLMVTEKYGPRLNLAVVPTTMVLEYNQEEVPSRCGNCTMCQTVCTSGAILGDQMFHPRQCESTVNCTPSRVLYSKLGWHDCDMCYRMCPQGTLQWEKEEKAKNWFALVDQNRNKPLAKHSVYIKDYEGGVKM